VAGFLYRQHADNCAMLPSGPAKLIPWRMVFSSAFSAIAECIKVSSVYDIRSFSLYVFFF